MPSRLFEQGTYFDGLCCCLHPTLWAVRVAKLAVSQIESHVPNPSFQVPDLVFSLCGIDIQQNECHRRELTTDYPS
jgi:hypothetical protein